MNDKEKQLAINKAKAELTILKHLVAQKYGELTGENPTIFMDILDLINRLDKITKDLGLEVKSVIK